MRQVERNPGSDPYQPEAGEPITGDQSLIVSLPPLPPEVVKCYPLAEGAELVLHISRFNGLVASLHIQQIRATGDIGEGFEVQINATQLATQLELLLGSDGTITSLIQLIESAQSLEEEHCTVLPQRSLTEMRENVLQEALYTGFSESASRQCSSLSRLIDGSTQDHFVKAKALRTGSALLLSVSFDRTADNTLVVDYSVHEGEKKVLGLKRRAHGGAHITDLIQAANSAMRTFDVAAPDRYLEYCQSQKSMVLPIDLTACEPRFLHGRNLEQSCIELDPACFFSAEHLLRIDRQRQSIVAFSMLDWRSPVEVVALTIDRGACYAIELCFFDESSLVIDVPGDALFAGEPEEVQDFVRMTIEDLAYNPFDVAFKGANYCFTHPDRQNVIEFVAVESIAAGKVAYHLWRADRDAEGNLLPEHFGSLFDSGAILRAPLTLNLLSGEAFELRLKLSPGGIAEIQVLEPRGVLSRLFTGSSLALRGSYPIAHQEDLRFTEEIVDTTVQLTRSLSRSGLRWGRGNDLDCYLRGLSPAF